LEFLGFFPNFIEEECSAMKIFVLKRKEWIRCVLRHRSRKINSPGASWAVICQGSTEERWEMVDR